MDDDLIDPSWTQELGETAKWFSRFLRYADLPPSARSVRAAWLAECAEVGKIVQNHARSGTPSDWLNRSRRHGWDARAADRDAARRRDMEATIAALRDDWAAGRRDLITASTATVRAALAGLDVTGPNAPGLGEVVRAMARLFALQRTEMGEDTTDLRLTIAPAAMIPDGQFDRDELGAMKAAIAAERRLRGLRKEFTDDDRDE